MAGNFGFRRFGLRNLMSHIAATMVTAAVVGRLSERFGLIELTDQLRFYTAMSVSNKERVMDADMFLKGQEDCRDGKPHQGGKGESYDRGYGTQYELEQIQEAMSRG